MCISTTSSMCDASEPSASDSAVWHLFSLEASCPGAQMTRSDTFHAMAEGKRQAAQYREWAGHWESSEIPCQSLVLQ